RAAGLLDPGPGRPEHGAGRRARPAPQPGRPGAAALDDRRAGRDPPGDVHAMRAGRRRSGQALIESAITIPVLLVLLLGFLLVMVVAQAVVDLDTATGLAAAS